MVRSLPRLAPIELVMLPRNRHSSHSGSAVISRMAASGFGAVSYWALPRALAGEQADDEPAGRDEHAGLRVERLDPTKLFVEGANRYLVRETGAGRDTSVRLTNESEPVLSAGVGSTTGFARTRRPPDGYR